MNNILPGIPLIESPLLNLEFHNLDLNENEKRIANDLFNNGYSIFKFPDDEINEKIDRIKKNLSPRYGIDFNNIGSDKTHGERRIQDAWKFDKDVRAIAANQAVIDLLGKLYGRPAFPFQTLNFPVGTQQAAHSDSVHFSSLPERFMCGVWLAMEDVHPDAGPLFYYPGSHRWPIITNGLIGRHGYGTELESAQEPYEAVWRNLCHSANLLPETFLPKKGDALIWAANLLHGGSHQNDPTLTRWSQVTHYYFDDCIYYTPSYSDEYIGNLCLRNVVSIVDDTIKPNVYIDKYIENKKVKGTQFLDRFKRIVKF